MWAILVAHCGVFNFATQRTTFSIFQALKCSKVIVGACCILVVSFKIKIRILCKIVISMIIVFFVRGNVAARFLHFRLYMTTTSSYGGQNFLIFSSDRLTWHLSDVLFQDLILLDDLLHASWTYWNSCC